MTEEQCWCGHVKAHHSEWAAGVFCMNVKCGCRHYGRAGTQLAKVRELKSAQTNYQDALRDALNLIEALLSTGGPAPGTRMEARQFVQRERRKLDAYPD